MKKLTTAVSTHWSPLNTTVCWVPSNVISAAPIWRARSIPAWYGVAGSCVVETTTTLPGPGEEAGCGVDVGGTGHIAHRSRGANPVKVPYSTNGAAARIWRSAPAHTAGSVGYGASTQRIAAKA